MERLRRHLRELQERGVTQRVASDDLGLEAFVRVVHVGQRDFNRTGILHDVVVRQDEASLVDDEAAAGAFGWHLARCLGPGLAAAFSEREGNLKAEQVLRPTGATWRVVITRMLTTAGLVSCAIFLNVVASTGPDSGALLVAGTWTAFANEAGARSSREARIMPPTTEIKAMSTP